MTVMETQGNNFDVMAGSAGYLLPAIQFGTLIILSNQII